MNVSLTPKLEKLVQRKVASGRYASASEVIREALRMMEDQERTREQKLEELRREIQIGLDQAERGEVHEGDEVFAELRRIAKSHESPAKKRTTA